jgi:putative spermidine/putrescine transport system substrate-binding protein
MDWVRQHRSDLASILAEKLQSGVIDRRSFLQGLAALGLVAAVRPTPAGAASGELVVVNWGGLAATAFEKAWARPCQEKLGLKMVVDGSGPTAGKLRAMIDAKNVTWDACDGSVLFASQLGEAGYLEEIDYSVVDKSRVRPQFAYKYGVCNYMFSYVMAVNKQKFGANPPKTWQDFWNLKDFPGKRMLRGSANGVLEAALLADGVDPKSIYPIDVDRAFAKIREIKANTIFWKSGAQSEDLIRQGEVVAGLMWHNRANLVRIESKNAIEWPWQGAIVAPSLWVVPKGNPAGKDAAMKFINLALEPDSQIELFKIVGMSPSNPAAAAKMPDEDRRWDATQPDNLAVQVPINDDWYGKNGTQVEAKYLELISS